MNKFKIAMEYGIKLCFMLSAVFVMTVALLFLVNPSLFQRNNIQIITPQVIVVSEYEDEDCDEIEDDHKRDECLTEQEEKEQAEYEKANAQEVACVRQALWYEARGEGKEGILAVASVIVNRVKSNRYPNSFCEVIHQPMQFSYVHEFKAKGKSLNVVPKPVELEVFREVNIIAHKVVLGQFQPTLQPNVLWYAHQRINNYWTKKKKLQAQIGKHKFYAI